MKWTVPLLLGCLVLGSAVPTSAENVVVDSTVLETIQSHLVRALDGLNRMNLQRAWNHITRAMNLIPDPEPVPLGLFKIKTAFFWSASSGPMPIRIGAMIDDG